MAAPGYAVRWGDKVSALVTASPSPGDRLAGPVELVAVPRIQGRCPRIWQLVLSVQATEDPGSPIWQIRLRAQIGVGSTVRPATLDTYTGPQPEPVEIFQTLVGATELRVTAEIYLAAFSPIPTVLPSVIQAWVTCAPFSPPNETEVPL